MKFLNRVLICVGCAALLCLAWFLVMNKTPESEIQADLVTQAEALMQDEIYVRAVPILEEAQGLEGPLRDKIEALLKESYVALSKKADYVYRLEALIEKQIQREDSPKSVYYEARDYYLAMGRMSAAIKAMRCGMEHLGDEELRRDYEAIRYSFTATGKSYDEVTMVYNGKIQVKGPAGWGMASSSGGYYLPCQYDQISTYSTGTVAVMQDGELFTVDADGFRTYLYEGEAEQIGNFANGLLAIKTKDGWVRATGTLLAGSMAFEELGMYSEGYAPAKQNGKWGVIDSSGAWVLQPEYDEIIMDELGRCWIQGAVFVRKGDQIKLYSGGQWLPDAYEDAKPFLDGWAAVKQDGKWMFIDTAGQPQLVCGYEDVGSFSGHLAPAMKDGLWGYISLDGTLVIDAQFQEAKSFTGRYAPVKTEDRWTFIMLDEELEG